MTHPYASIKGRYTVRCFDEHGNLKWEDVADNLITTVGKNSMLDNYLEGSSFTTTAFMGLKGTGSAAAGDTQASHAGWAELTDYSGNRKTPSFGAAASGVKATDAVVTFSITGTMTVAGVFLNIGGSATKSDTTGTLFSAGDFSGGNRAVVNLDTLEVTYSVTLT